MLAPMTRAISPATTLPARAGVPTPDTLPRPRSPKPSRLSANSSRAPPTVQARQQPNALTIAPSVIVLPTQEPTHELPRSPISEEDLPNAATPAASVPKPIDSTAVTPTKNRPPKIAVP